MNILNKLQKMADSRLYWAAYGIGGISLLGVALIYQHVFEELPCVVCIQIRLWISLLIVLSAGGLWLREKPSLNLLMQWAIVLTSAGFVERSYLLLGTERGFIFGACGFDVGLPSWFAVEQWLPWLYQVETSCGYTPELLFGITMAEALIALSVSLLLVSSAIALASTVGLFQRKS
ncbi:hypothetical protein MNBD_GAMMA08-1972 [hydrothermal vent metagenome]|uniref:Periplasmic thiol:disulfide oxidoreductase DsbB, required for DsbA reoxidation n=1 Tax=hydrothermal vent metagenome TaxID=652676 RepID=A0A3B0WTN6_9ZZZZ